MLRVAVVTHYFPTSKYPWEGHSAYQTLRQLAKRRCELEVFYPLATYPKWIKRWNPLPQDLDPMYQPTDVRVRYIPYPALPVLSRPLNGWLASRYLLPHVAGFGPDVILSYVLYPDGFAALRIAQELKVPVVVKAIGSDLNRISDPLCELLTCYVLRHSEHVCTVSRHLLQTALRLGARPDRSTAIINGCDPAIFRPQDKTRARESLGIQTDSAVIVYIGRLDIRKGLRELIEAASRLRVSQNTLRCFFVGDGPDRQIVLDAIERHGLRDVAVIIPSCPTAEVSRWMAAADVVTLPSYAEGCPNVVLEALASGRPVVATNVGGIPEIMDETVGRLIPPRDIPSLTVALGDVLQQTWDESAIAMQHRRTWSDVAYDLELSLAEALKVKDAGPVLKK